MNNYLIVLGIGFVLGALAYLYVSGWFKSRKDEDQNIEGSIEFLRKHGFNIYAPGYKKEDRK